MGKRVLQVLQAGIILCVMLGVAYVGAAAAATEELEEFDGLIDPYLIVDVGSEVFGVLDSIKIDRGDKVKAGQVLATLRAGVEVAAQELAKARAQSDAHITLKRNALEFAVRNSRRTKELYDARAVPFQKWDEVETQRIMAENELAQAMEQKLLFQLEHRQASEVLKRKTILSPVSGVVMERYLSPGEYVENKPILKLAQIDPLKVEVVMPISCIGLVKTGMSATVKPEAPVGGALDAVVTIVDPVMDAASGTFGVRLKISNPGYLIPPGLKCKVVFQKQ